MILAFVEKKKRIRFFHFESLAINRLVKKIFALALVVYSHLKKGCGVDALMFRPVCKYGTTSFHK